ncbi:MAG: hypothetical protein HY908_19560 [Myxococcales bacterium]|nr:hypothetical protein [Myxococcales bacterium]
MKTRPSFGVIALVGLGTALASALASGCSTEAFCTDNCDTGSSTTSSTGSHTGGTGGGCLFGNCSGSTSSAGSGPGGDGGTGGAGGGCEGADFNAPQTCGTCDHNCYLELTNVDISTITCTWSGTPGEAGTCAFTDCQPNYWDWDQDGLSCEFYCVQSALDDVTCNNKDDDCDKEVDEDVDLCTDTANCGICGNNCVVVHGTAACVNNGQQPCAPANTHCEVLGCDLDWWDADNSYATGCEYNCVLTNGGVEICGDGLDNDCDGKIDAADGDLSGDPQLGVACYGGAYGLCHTAPYAGATQCVGNQVVCVGANLLLPDQQAETCNLVDDDCDNVVDDVAPVACGLSAVFPCQKGLLQCQSGTPVCIGAIDPGVESCNGVDDDCDGVIDKAGGQEPADAVGVCDVPIPPPPGASSPCQAGNKACQGGVVVCLGSVGPTSVTDGCNIDANCDGQLTNQPDTTSDVSNCNGCGNDCYAGSQHEVWSCVASTCTPLGCQPGYHDNSVPADGLCEYGPCFPSGAEVCNGVDDDCNGVPDDNIGNTPTPVQVCGVSPAATRPECTSGVTVSCNAGTWQCSFPAGVCNPTCAGATELCDALDNDCDASLNENVPNYGLPCASDDGLPPPGHGACRTTGTYVCNGPNATTCSAVKNNAAAGPELCDGIDNDCDAVVDESFRNKGSNATYFVKPVVTKISATRWVFSYEATRPNAEATSAGTGNGYHYSAATLPNPNPNGIPAAPVGVTLDKTRACSVPAKLPWFNVNPTEVEQTCDAMGGFACSATDWQNACDTTPPSAANCTWGYNTRGAPCTSAYTASKYCNLGPSFDFLPGVSGDQDGLLPVGSASLLQCFADWSTLEGNTAATNKIYDITGNLREITKSGAGIYPLMGGAFDSATDSGATCSFTFYTVDQLFALYDTGFRCCFSADPTL